MADVHKEWQRSLYRLICLSPCLLVFLVSSSFAQEEKAGPELKAKFHQDFRGGDPRNPNLRLIRDDNFRWEATGARITMPAGEGKMPTTGIAANFKIKGDFEITTSYEVLSAEKPIIHFNRTKSSTAPAGKLRIQRLGSMVRFFVAEGDDPAFIAINQSSAKSQTNEVEFGAAEIRYFQIGGDAGDSQSALDMRLLDFTVRAEELPGLIEVAPAKQDMPAWVINPPGTKADESNGWRDVILILGLALAVIGLGAFLWLRRRRPGLSEDAAVHARKAKPAEPATTVSSACSDCGKMLKVKPELAGKK